MTHLWVQVLRMGMKTLPLPFLNLSILDGDDTREVNLDLEWDGGLIQTISDVPPTQ